MEHTVRNIWGFGESECDPDGKNFDQTGAITFYVRLQAGHPQSRWYQLELYNSQTQAWSASGKRKIKSVACPHEQRTKVESMRVPGKAKMRTGSKCIAWLSKQES